ncbi:DUF7522 family protein [Haloglomus litoreum]|uniref:DUF7522 family protein n=1 Tax=Haloglomus litoreum TaxID=3034026 RepID=UPI0023E8E23E|nr:hypothetical protein [Haloglomus sp. DT116]
MRPTPDAITDEFRTDLGDELRMVAQYDADGLEVLYVRDDVDRRRSDVEFESLHEELLRENRSRTEFEGQFNSGPLRSAMLGFEEFVAFHFISTDDTGYVVTVEPDTTMNITEFVRKFETTARVKSALGNIVFQHTEVHVECPRCGGRHTISTPEAGPDSSYYCLDCDQSFN